MAKEDILLIGCTSKLGRLFIDFYEDEFNFYGTYSSTPPAHEKKFTQLFELDLNNQASVTDFIVKTKKISFKAVLFLASTYEKDHAETSTFLDQLLANQTVNLISPVAIARDLHYDASMGRVIFFGDAGLSQPKPHFVSYSLSKVLMEQAVKSLAVELKDRALCIAFRLGPTIAPEEAIDKEGYYAKNLIAINDVASGLVKYLHFVIAEPNLNVTGTFIDYDGGTYLRRSGTK